MLHKLRVLYKAYKAKIWKTIGIIVLLIVILQIINSFVKNNRNKTNNSNVANENTNITYLPSDTAISGVDLNKETATQNKDIIDKFINSCNNKDLEQAYNMLSTACKNEMYNTIDDFNRYYYSTTFTKFKSYNMQSWFNTGITTYKIKLVDDILSSGTINEEYIEDYYTIVTENNEKKLNINKLIKKETVEKEFEKENIKFKIISRIVYMDYEKYSIEVTNSNSEKVIIDTKAKVDTVYLRDKNGVRYSWYGNEIDNKNLELEQDKKIQLEIKFNKIYNPERKNSSINFADVRKKEKVVEVNIDI